MWICLQKVAQVYGNVLSFPMCLTSRKDIAWSLVNAQPNSSDTITSFQNMKPKVGPAKPNQETKTRHFFQYGSFLPAPNRPTDEVCKKCTFLERRLSNKDTTFNVWDFFQIETILSLSSVSILMSYLWCEDLFYNLRLYSSLFTTTTLFVGYVNNFSLFIYLL